MHGDGKTSEGLYRPTATLQCRSLGLRVCPVRSWKTPFGQTALGWSAGLSGEPVASGSVARTKRSASLPGRTARTSEELRPQERIRGPGAGRPGREG